MLPKSHQLLADAPYACEPIKFLLALVLVYGGGSASSSLGSRREASRVSAGPRRHMYTYSLPEAARPEPVSVASVAACDTHVYESDGVSKVPAHSKGYDVSAATQLVWRCS